MADGTFNTFSTASRQPNDRYDLSREKPVVWPLFSAIILGLLAAFLTLLQGHSVLVAVLAYCLGSAGTIALAFVVLAAADQLSGRA